MGTGYATTHNFRGYISNARIATSALYTANFTPSTTPLTAVSGTSLLTCQSNRLRDASSNNFTITRNGDVRVEKFSPFAPTAAYLPATEGGSAYFDGTGDYLKVPFNAALTFGTNNLTLEAWIYPTAYNAGASTIMGQGQANSSAAFSVGIMLTSTGALNMLAAPSSGSYSVNATGGAAPLNTWTHVAITRSGSSWTLWVNGVSVATATSTVTVSQDSSNNTLYGGMSVGSAAANSAFTFFYFGYIANARALNGTAVYTAAFTPPTAPVTAIANTSLLLNFTNAGVFDNAATNDLETVGSVQISTAVSRFGTGSMSFTGSPSYLRVLTAMAGESLAFGTGDFTIEWWMYATAVGTNQYIFDWRASGATILAYSMSATQLDVYVGTNSAITIDAHLDMWAHIAIVRSAGVVTVYRDGVAKGSFSSSTNLPKTGLIIGQRFQIDGVNFAGYIDDFRVTKGVARYVANFTPPALPFPDK